MNYKELYDAGWHALYAGHLSKGISLLDSGRYINHHGSAPLKTKAELLTRENLSRGGTLLFNCEAGIGDQIANIRFVENFAEYYKVIIVCEKSLWPLFRSVKGVSALITKEVVNQVDAQYWVPSMSSPGILGLEYNQLYDGPYLTPNINSMWNKLRDNQKLNIGIRWYGSSKQEDQQRKRFDPQKLFDLAEFENVKVFSLQRDDGIELLPKNSKIVDLSKYMSTWDRTASIMAYMDLIISSCTSIAHLGGAMGIPTWVITPKTQWYTWIYPEGENTAWYQSVKLFRQEQNGSWLPALNKIHQKLSNIQHDDISTKKKTASRAINT